MKGLKTFWCYYNPNFGDALNREIFRRLGGFDIEYAPVHAACVIGIGSILGKVLAGGHSPHSADGVLRVFSSGFDVDPTIGMPNSADVSQQVFQRDLMCYAVRGVKTAGIIRSLAPDAPVGVLGDGGLLLKFLMHDHIESKYHVGVVPHYVERNNPAFVRLMEGLDDAVLLDPCEGVENFVHHLCECRVVVSTALHPLIACDALGIPNRWLRLSDSVLSHFKFEDYYSIYGDMPTPLDPLTCSLDDLTEESIRAHYTVPAEMVAETQERLMESFECLCRDLRRPWWRGWFLR